ncbi:DNA-3-methyladenine glycosylase 2 family protein [Rhodococcus sp. BP-349]|nr:DNA-3-methyladenine glycosylase 2 family protein [Rhodococcus sp. BP-363]MBY6542940.1 DNA-3-methyladenine glycosylase 2 family protein [Rhodococcus sp. BP-369]MBY6562170.1 DNA-3-methyladenine glycosylase 2 family protein [Rhodococcus sp. BP-370]MBY6576462.1 DNA-3-methyladenine glycosylase 2 family protein [Rhodococcus sp. BP-364]MBY6585763.1 DNA-3-methyladenine glycosylase 2 family protein [Rhodococcus sp. BP-358]MBY6590100.1 DNA-3-methyladenine glycosylase 2 family protein [Rhodococcus sp.
MRWFLAGHAVPGMETFVDGVYRRSLRLDHGLAVVSCRFEGTAVEVHTRASDSRDIPTALDKVRRVLALDVDATAVDAVLAADPALRPSVEDAPGIRVPGAFDPAEVLLRTMIGQQISLGAAATHTARLVAALGDPVGDDEGEAEHGITRLFPTPEAVAARGAEILTGPARRVAAIASTAAALASGAVDVRHDGDAATQERALLALRGVGPWTARYVSMRLLGDPDVLLDTDLVVRQGAALLDIDLSDTAHWAPWRSYASMHLWRTALLARGLTIG